MRKFLLFTCMVINLPMYAQYFQHIYGTRNNEENQWGMNTVQMGPGFIISGLGTNQQTGAVAIEISRTDINGDVPAAPYFNKAYRLRSSANVNLNVTDAKAIEINSSTIGVAGTWYNPAAPASRLIYYCSLDSAGVPLTTTFYRNPTEIFFQLHSIKKEPGGTNIYLTGLANNSANGENRIYVLKIASNGALIWSHTYDRGLTSVGDDRAYDVMEDINTGEVIVVGTVADNFQTDAFYLRLDATTGAPIVGTLDTYGDSTTYDQFSTVDYSNDANNNFGQIIGGYTNATPGADFDVWAVRIDNSFNTLWTNVYDYNNSTVTNICRDIIERQNTNGDYEYYAGGITNAGALGSSDIEVDKIDVNGASVSQFTYGITTGESFSTLDQNNSGSSDGLSIFGLTRYTTPNFANNELYIVKAYFNGVTTCNYYINTITEAAAPGYITSLSINTVDNFFTFSGNMISGIYKDSTICLADGVDKGDNRSTTTEKPNGLKLNVYDAGTNGMMLNIAYAEAGIATLVITDMLGRTVEVKQLLLTADLNTIAVDLPSHCTSGLYLVTLTQNNRQDSKKIVFTR